MFKSTFAAIVVCLSLAAPSFADDKSSKLDEKAFAADYKALIKKFPGAQYRFHLFDTGEAKPGPDPRCRPDCWFADVGVCYCFPPHKELWE
jgi:hypothetical protein